MLFAVLTNQKNSLWLKTQILPRFDQFSLSFANIGSYISEHGEPDLFSYIVYFTYLFVQSKQLSLLTLIYMYLLCPSQIPRYVHLCSFCGLWTSFMGCVDASLWILWILIDIIMCCCFQFTVLDKDFNFK